MKLPVRLVVLHHVCMDSSTVLADETSKYFQSSASLRSAQMFLFASSVLAQSHDVYCFQLFSLLSSYFCHVRRYFQLLFLYSVLFPFSFFFTFITLFFSLLLKYPHFFLFNNATTFYLTKKFINYLHPSSLTF